MSSFGTLFRVTTFGESHGRGVGAIVDGVPPRLALAEDDIQPQLDRRRPGQNKLTTQRNEKDRVVIQSGIEKGYTLGTPIGLFVANEDQRPMDYSETNSIPRPSHADFTYQQKYNIRASSGGGRASARETIGRVAAGTIAEKWLSEKFGASIVAWVSSISTIDSAPVDLCSISRQLVDSSPVRCPDVQATQLMIQAIEAAKSAKDSLGGIVSCVIRNVPAGLGEPCFDKLEALLAHAMLSIPATKGFEIGSGFAGTRLRGSQHNDPFVIRNNQQNEDPEKKAISIDDCLISRFGTATNNSGGIQGGISNSEPIIFRVAFKPPATIGLDQETVNFNGEKVILAAKGRHDPCVVPRAVPIVEAMAALVIADAALIQISRLASIPGQLLPPWNSFCLVIIWSHVVICLQEHYGIKFILPFSKIISHKDNICHFINC